MSHLSKRIYDFCKKRGEYQWRKNYLKIRHGVGFPEHYKLTYICPEEIEYVVTTSFCQELPRPGIHFRAGDWDKKYYQETLMYHGQYQKDLFPKRGLVKISNVGMYQSFVERFEYATPWNETAFYEWLVEQTQPIIKYESQEQINNRLQMLDDIFDSMTSNQYKTQLELGETRPFLPNTCDEVLVNRTREDTLVLDDGRHRFFLAKVAGVDKVPVREFVRHRHLIG